MWFRFSTAARAGAAVFVCAAAASCGGANKNVKSENQELRATVSALRTDARRSRMRIRDLEKQIALLEQQRGPRAAATAPAASTPELPVEVRTPETLASADELPDDYEVVGTNEEGVQIVYVGEAAADESVRPPVDRYNLSEGASSPAPTSRRAHRSGDRRELAPVPTVSDRLAVTDSVPRIDSAMRQARPAAPPARPGAVDPRAEYRRYYEALRAGNHDFAITGLRNFVARFPAHEYADNAQYWLGEAFYDQKKYAEALAEFRKVVDGYSRGNKVPDALLKIGFCHARLGDEKKARAALKEVASRYPKSNPASLARKKLAELED